VWLSKYEYFSSGRDAAFTDLHYVVLLQHGYRLTGRWPVVRRWRRGSRALESAARSAVTSAQTQDERGSVSNDLARIPKAVYDSGTTSMNRPSPQDDRPEDHLTEPDRQVDGAVQRSSRILCTARSENPHVPERSTASGVYSTSIIMIAHKPRSSDF
jgi:hypothetical protein